MKNRLYISALSLLLILAWAGRSMPALGQEVNFNTYAGEDITLTVTNQEMSFGENGMVVSGTQTQPNKVEIPLTSGKKTTITIEGVQFLDVIVEITGPSNITNGDQNIPLDLKAAYANLGQDQIAQSRSIILDSNNYGTQRFRIKGRGNGPPGPPPVPDHEGYSPPTGSAYLYLYGEIQVGDVNSGTYTGTIRVDVSYAQNQ